MSKAKEKRDDPTLLDDIRSACRLIASFIRKVKLPDFVASQEKQSAVTHQLMIIGEASCNLSDSAKNYYPRADWDELIDLRHLIAHHYYKVNALRLWEYASTDVPRLLRYLNGP